MNDSVKPSLTDYVKRLWDPLWLRSWVHSQRDKKGMKAFAIRQVEVFVLTTRSLYQENITLRAAALTYHTLLSIVPLLAVAFALFKAFGGLKRLESPLRAAVVDNLAMGRADEVGKWLDTFVTNINAGAIAGAGVLILFYSAVGLLTNLERSLNQIWHSRRRRSFFVRFAIFWCLVTLAPPLMGYSISLSAKLQSSAFAASAVNWLPFGLGKVLLTVTSMLSVCVTFTLIYLVVPAAKVRVKAAALGGLVAGLLWNLSKFIFISFTAGSLKYSAIYGALGVLPLLMIWIYISWLVVLFGATYAFATQTVATEELHAGRLPLNQSFRELMASRLLLAVATTFRRGAPPPTMGRLVQETGSMTQVVRQVLEVLITHGLLVETTSGSERTFLPGQDLQQLSLGQVAQVLRQGDGRTFDLNEDAPTRRLKGLLEQAEAASRDLLQQSFYALSDGAGGGEESRGSAPEPPATTPG